MRKISFKVESNLCDDCVLALRRFIGHLDGVDDIDVEDGRVVVNFDELKITDKEISRITKDSMEKLGYRLVD
ncbi:MAG: hypothetical protein HZB30_11310 [Nitrospirae bacterium]|nr:hypothetical protein [Nitrospirota bacterium]